MSVFNKGLVAGIAMMSIIGGNATELASERADDGFQAILKVHSECQKLPYSPEFVEKFRNEIDLLQRWAFARLGSKTDAPFLPEAKKVLSELGWLVIFYISKSPFLASGCDFQYDQPFISAHTSTIISFSFGFLDKDFLKPIINNPNLENTKKLCGMIANVKAYLDISEGRKRIEEACK